MYINQLFSKNRIFQMKLLKKTLVAAGIATAVFATGAAQAASVSSPSKVTPPALPIAAKTIVNEASRAVISLEPVTLTMQGTGGLQQISVGSSIRIALSAGKFTSAGTLNGLGTTLVSGGIGTDFLLYEVTGVNPGNIDLTGAEVDGRLIPDNGQVKINVNIATEIGGSSEQVYGSNLTAGAGIEQLALQLEPALAAEITAVAGGEFLVAAGFRALANVNALGESTAGPATITFTPSVGADTGRTTATGGNVPAGPQTPTSVVVTIVGPMAGVKSIGAPFGSNIEGSTAAGVGTTPATPDKFNIGAGAAYGRLTAIGTSSFGITFDGSVAYEPGAYTAQVRTNPDAAGGYLTPRAQLVQGTVFAFTRDGSSFTANTFGALNKLTVTDRSGSLGGSGADGSVTITAYDATGAEVVCADSLLGNLPSNGTMTVSGEDIQTNCPGAKRIEGAVNSSNIFVSNTKKTEDGATSQSGANANSTIAI
jgi:hypothetical protein